MALGILQDLQKIGRALRQPKGTPVIVDAVPPVKIVGRFAVNEGVPDGYMPFTYKGKEYRIWGGPYVNKPKDMVGVKMAKEIDRPCTINVPTVDFSVPNMADLKRGVIEALYYLQQGHEVYVGCMGGIGRTGLFMAALAKHAGVKDPVGHVRATYKGHAVETQQQQDFVRQFQITGSQVGAYMLNARKKYERQFPPTFKVRVRRWIKKQLIALADAI